MSNPLNDKPSLAFVACQICMNRGEMVETDRSIVEDVMMVRRMTIGSRSGHTIHTMEIHMVECPIAQQYIGS